MPCRQSRARSWNRTILLARAQSRSPAILSAFRLASGTSPSSASPRPPGTIFLRPSATRTSAAQTHRQSSARARSSSTGAAQTPESLCPYLHFIRSVNLSLPRLPPFSRLLQTKALESIVNTRPSPRVYPRRSSFISMDTTWRLSLNSILPPPVS